MAGGLLGERFIGGLRADVEVGSGDRHLLQVGAKHGDGGVGFDFSHFDRFASTAATEGDFPEARALRTQLTTP